MPESKNVCGQDLQVGDVLHYGEGAGGPITAIEPCLIVRYRCLCGQEHSSIIKPTSTVSVIDLGAGEADGQ